MYNNTSMHCVRSHLLLPSGRCGDTSIEYAGQTSGFRDLVTVTETEGSTGGRGEGGVNKATRLCVCVCVCVNKGACVKRWGWGWGWGGVLTRDVKRCVNSSPSRHRDLDLEWKRLPSDPHPTVPLTPKRATYHNSPAPMNKNDRP